MPRKIESIMRDYKGMKLCDNCWNGAHYRFRDKNADGKPIHKYCACTGCGCQCPCSDLMKPERKVKFTGEGQTSISMEDCLVINKESTTVDKSSCSWCDEAHEGGPENCKS